MKKTEQYVWCLAYIDKDHIGKLEKDLNKSNQYIGMEAHIPTVKVLKKKFKQNERFDDVPLLFNYGFFKVPLLWALNQDLLQKIKDDITCLSHWVKDPARVLRSTGKDEMGNTIALGQKDVRVATVTSEEVMRLVKLAREESIYSSDEIERVKPGDIITLMCYPFEDMEAKVLEVDLKHKKVKVAMKLEGIGEDLYTGNPVSVSFQHVFYTIYRGSFHEDYNKEKTLTDYQSKKVETTDELTIEI